MKPISRNVACLVGKGHDVEKQNVRQEDRCKMNVNQIIFKINRGGSNYQNPHVQIGVMASTITGLEIWAQLYATLCQFFQVKSHSLI